MNFPKREKMSNKVQNLLLKGVIKELEPFTTLPKIFAREKVEAFGLS